MPPVPSVDLTCPSCAGASFEVHALKDEGLATVHCIGCNRDYLLLDSADHWFDAIQDGYPKPRKCGCKSASFHVRCDYAYRDDGDVRSVQVSTTCCSCRKTGRLLKVDVDYGDTESLVTDPLRYCANPKILYAFESLTLYVTRQEIAGLIDYLYVSHQCRFYTWLRTDGRWVKHVLDAAQTRNAVMQDRYFWIYASTRELDIPEMAVDSSASEDAFWKRHELIRISSATRIHSGGEEALLFYVKFANEHIDNGVVVRKSDAFADMTSDLLAWLKVHFVSWRGPRCFDNPHEHVRVFKDRFAKNR